MAAISKSVLKSSILLSLFSFGLFLLFYIMAALNYPGGSFAHPEQPGFSTAENYLCDLLDARALNGTLNTGKGYARISLGFLCMGILLFWFHLPALLSRKSKSIELMRISGMLSMIICIFLSAENHDMVTRMAALFGGLAMCLSFMVLFKVGLNYYAIFGFFCLLLILGNFYSYETGFFRGSLPLFQKFTTMVSMTWFVLLTMKHLKRLRL